ncbi:hypothetical protein LCGC14_2296180 [marine sediment metagenome]|uniref:Phage tail assembly protein n=1 Tax=marine sediment metagenome TaxID=412755 RepID=A0A0F9CQC7_9ZZZZ
MPKFSAKNVKFEPIEIEFDDATYTIHTLTAEDIERMSVLDGDAANTDPMAVPRMLASVLGAKPDTFLKTDLRVIGQVIKFLSKTITESFQDEGEAGKN